MRHRTEDEVVIHGKRQSKRVQRKRQEHGLTFVDSWERSGSDVIFDVFGGSGRSSGVNTGFVGRAELPISALVHNEQRNEQRPIEMWLPLRLRFDGSRGDIHLSRLAQRSAHVREAETRRKSQ